MVSHKKKGLKSQSGGKTQSGVGTSHQGSSSSGGRNKSGRLPGVANLSGPLRDRLKAHTFERCRHFFLFVTTLKMIEYLNNTAGRPPMRAAAFFEPKATHQIDDGFRSKDPEHVEFNRTDPNVIDETSTAFTKIDAAHYCNLGIKPALASQIDASNRVVVDLYENLKVFAGNTNWLPQIVNIGPDRVIDVMHGDFAGVVLKDTANAVCSRARIKSYVAHAALGLHKYIASQAKAKNYGKIACTKCYLAAYVETETIQFGTTKIVLQEQPDFVEKIFATMSGSIVGWCDATGNQAALPQLLSYN